MSTPQAFARNIVDGLEKRWDRFRALGATAGVSPTPSSTREDVRPGRILG